MFKNRTYSVMVAIALLLAIIFASFSLVTGGKATPDRSYDQVEQVRNRIGVDHSWDQIEKVRAQRLTGSLSADRSYDMIESLRLARASQNPAADRAYDAIENLRAPRMYK